MGLWRAGGGHRRVLCCCGCPKSPCPVSRLSWQPSTGLWQCHRAGRASPAESGPCQVCHLWPCSVFMDYRNVELSWQLQLFLWFSCWSHRTRNWECAPSCGCHSCPVPSACHTDVLCPFLWLPHSCPVLVPLAATLMSCAEASARWSPRMAELAHLCFPGREAAGPAGSRCRSEMWF